MIPITTSQKYTNLFENGIIVNFAGEMKERLRQNIAFVVLLLFVNFAFSNVIFMHTHSDGANGTVVHSHPYLPNSTHSHSSSSLAQIAAFNASAASFQGVAQQPVPESFFSSVEIETVYIRVSRHVEKTLAALRAPPCSQL